MILARLSLVAVTLTTACWLSLSSNAAQDSRPDRGLVPDWTIDAKHSKDVFTFVRVRYWSTIDGRRGREKWRTDYPDSDLNFSFRLRQLTSLRVHPDGLILDLDDPRLFDYPFLYMIEPGWLSFSEAEIDGLRRYCLGGGFLMVDDFWGEDQWLNFYDEIKRVFPDREPTEVPLEHDIFHCVYDLKEKPCVPSLGEARNHRYSGWSYETNETPHYRAIYDDDGRIMVFICHNTDLGDGWEREGEDEWYFREYSEKLAYPMGINIVVYAMTH